MKIILSFIVALCFFGRSLTAQTGTLVSELKVTGTQLTNASGKPVVLRGVSFGWHNWWPRFYNAGAVQWLKKDWSCSVVRAAMGVEPDKGYIQAKDWSKEK